MSVMLYLYRNKHIYYHIFLEHTICIVSDKLCIPYKQKILHTEGLSPSAQRTEVQLYTGILVNNFMWMISKVNILKLF